MDPARSHARGRPGRRPRTLLRLCLLAGTPLAAQSPCPDFGSVPTPAQWQPAPAPLGCPGAPSWPQWHLFTPFHRAPAPHPGFQPGDARARPRLLIAWRCTGWLLLPVLPVQVATMGYVVDQPESACSP